MSILVEVRPEAGPALVVGGGGVAGRKVRGLVDGGFAVTVVAPEVADAIRALAGITLEVREFAGDDIDRHPRWALVYACTDQREVNRLAGALARSRGIPVLVADAQAESTFFSPATLRDGGLQVGVSTGGADPALARELRDRAGLALGGGWASAVEQARQARDLRTGKGSSAP